MKRRDWVGIAGSALAALAVTDRASAQASRTSEVKVEKNVTTGKGGDTELHVDIYRPPSGTEKRMALVHFHGGGFVGGNKESLAQRVMPITARGYVSVTAQYRLGKGVTWLDQVADAATQFQWAKAHMRELGVDRVGVVGYSAGGYLALYTASRKELGVAACVAYYAAPEVARAVMPPGSDDAALHATNVRNRIEAGYPPTVMHHGLADVTVPPENSLKTLEVLRGAKVASELHTYANVPHVFDEHVEMAEMAAHMTDFFLDRVVLHPKTYPPFGAR
ncbi:MAG: hypothetical protein RL328_1542 [Acidobacteriota bacterium]|jgi:acetyl esterase/lipase